MLMMSEKEANEILCKIRELDNSIFQDNPTYMDALNVAIRDLEKQNPQPPIDEITMLGLDKGGRCPNCNIYINSSRHWLYCNCGQKIVWDAKMGNANKVLPTDKWEIIVNAIGEVTEFLCDCGCSTRAASDYCPDCGRNMDNSDIEERINHAIQEAIL